MQNYTSASTSVNKSRLPAVYSKAKITADTVMDYGCGKYTDHIRSALNGKRYLPYDPYNQSPQTNNEAVLAVREAMVNRKPVDIVCSNVLNVIDDDGVVRAIADELEYIALRTGGKAFVTVYEGDRSGIGRQTGSDSFQRNAPVRSYLQYFNNAVIRNGVIIVG